MSCGSSRVPRPFATRFITPCNGEIPRLHRVQLVELEVVRLQLRLVSSLPRIVGDHPRRDARRHRYVQVEVNCVPIAVELHLGGLNRFTVHRGVRQFQPSLPNRVQLRPMRLQLHVHRSADPGGRTCQPRQLRCIQFLRVQRQLKGVARSHSSIASIQRGR